MIFSLKIWKYRILTNRMYGTSCIGWVNPAWQMMHFLYSTTLRKIRGSISVSNFEEIIFLKFFDINFQNFGASSLAEKTNCLKVIFDPRNEFSGWNYFRKHVFLCRFFFKNGSFWGLKITKIGIFSQNQFFFEILKPRTP